MHTTYTGHPVIDDQGERVGGKVTFLQVAIGE